MIMDKGSAVDTNSTLTLSLPTDTEIVITRLLDAPRELVFEAWTRPEHIRRWWGPSCMTMIQCDMDVRVGGAYRFLSRMEDGSEHGFSGVYREVTPPERLVHTFVYDPYPDHDAVITLMFEDRDGRTLMTETIVHKTREGRDGHYYSGMEVGMRESLSRLDEVLATMRG